MAKGVRIRAFSLDTTVVGIVNLDKGGKNGR